jgi:hypothetical protein
MKNILYILFAILIVSCNKDDDSNDTLPPATQTGAGTFACYVNGKAFIDKSGSFNCFYQLVDGEYYFHITAHDVVEGIDEITIFSDKVQIAEGEVYELSNFEEFSISGMVFFKDSTLYTNSTSSTPGVLTITKLDTGNLIISGTFSFEVRHPITGNTIIISEGRFDSLFTI